MPSTGDWTEPRSVCEGARLATFAAQRTVEHHLVIDDFVGGIGQHRASRKFVLREVIRIAGAGKDRIYDTLLGAVVAKIKR